MPAYRAMVPELVPSEDLPSANSLMSLSGELIGIVGPALGAGVIALSGTPVAFALNAASFVVAAGCLLSVLGMTLAPPRAGEASPGLLADTGEGLRAVASSPWLWVTITVAGLSNIAYSGPMGIVLPFLVADRYGPSVGVLGLFYSASSLGAVLAAVWLGRLPKLRRRSLALYGSWLLIGIFVTLIGLPIAVSGLLAAAFCIGACNSILGLVWVNSLQELVPNYLLGRVSSVDYLGSFILLPVGYAIGGWAESLVGPSLAFILGGALQSALVKVRSLD